MSPLPDDPAFVQQQDQVGVGNGAEVVRIVRQVLPAMRDVRASRTLASLSTSSPAIGSSRMGALPRSARAIAIRRRCREIREPPQRRALDVHERRDAGPLPSRRAHGVDHVDRLAALGQRDHQRALRDEVHEVGKFGAGRDGDSAPRDPCEQVLRGERGVAGAAHRRGHELLGAGRRRGEALLEQVRHHLGIRLRAEPMTGAHEWLTELAVVGDDAVVDEREPARAVQVRMGVVLRHAAMRGPACVPDADRARPQVRPRLADLADALIDDDPVTVADGHTPRVVAPILELLEAAQNEVRRVLASRNSIRLRS